MCGIAGILDPQNPTESHVVDKLVDSLTHRGPDDRGTYVDGSMAFGMRRLSIIDLSTGHQPIFNEDGTLCIVFNGEIYNFPELRERLQAAGHKFSTHSDTEAILHLYEERGEDCLQELQGMFAFAVWDRMKKKLFVARDRFGIKPLYYAWNGSKLIFSSEIKSMLAFPGFDRTLDPRAVDDFFTYLYVPHERTLFRAIKKLLPGHCLSVEEGTLQIRRWYDLPSPASTPPGDVEEWVDAFFEIGRETVKKHLLSDVPLGAFLSGGVDSSLVVALMSGLIDRPVDTFSIGYDETGASFDERVYARQVAERFGCRHREFVVQPDMVSNFLPEMLGRLDEPFGDASVIPNYLLSQFARQHVTVALTGLGGDEVCAGYERYLGAIAAERWKALTKLLSARSISSLIASIPDSKKGAHLPERLKRLARYAALPLKERYYNFISKFDDQERSRLFSPQFKSALAAEDGFRVYDIFWERAARFKGLSSLLSLDLETYLTDDLLALSDRTSMAHSLEIRVPFVDHKLVEFFWQMPSNLKLRGVRKKFLLKKAAERVLPKTVIYRKKKGFSVPLTVWFRGLLKPYVLDILSEQGLKESGIFDAAYVKKLLDEHMTGRRNHDERIYSLLSFLVWRKTYL